MKPHFLLAASLAALVTGLSACGGSPSGTMPLDGSGGATDSTGETGGDIDSTSATGGSDGGSTGASGGSDGGSTSTGASGGSDGGSTGTGAGGEAITYPVPDWPQGDAAEQGFDAAKLAEAVAVAESKESYCLLVIRHGVLVSENYWQGTDATTANDSWSIAKSYSSTLVGIAIDRGDIASLDDSAADYVPEWVGTDKEAITIRNLVSMTSGLHWDAFQDYVTMVTFAQDQTKFALDLDLSDDPGTKWVYHNGGVQVLEAVFRGATGVTMEEYAQDHLWSKLGMTATWKHDPAGHDTAYANVLASCRDHARLGYLYLHQGKWAGGEQVLSEQWISQALSPSQDQNRAYGFLFWLNGQTPALDAMSEPWDGEMVPFAPPDLFAARGFGNQFIDVIPSLDLVVVRFGPDPLNNFDIGALTTDSRFETHDQILKPVLDAIVN